MKIHYGGLPSSISQKDVLNFVIALEGVDSAEIVDLHDIDIGSLTPFRTEHFANYQSTAILVKGMHSGKALLLFQNIADWNRQYSGYDPSDETNEAGEKLVLWYRIVALSSKRCRERWVQDQKSLQLCVHLMDNLAEHYK